jgi:hypothetical protein
MASQNLPWAFHKVYASSDVHDILGYPNHCPIEWRANCPKFNGDPPLAVTHVAKYINYASSLDLLREDVLHEDVLMKIFVSSLEPSQRNFLACSCDPKSIPSSAKLIGEFLRHYRPATQNLQDTSEELKDTLFSINKNKEKLEEDHDEEVLEESVDATYLFEKGHMKHSTLRIKPHAMKSRWRSMHEEKKES